MGPQSGDLMQNNSSSTGNTNNHYTNWSQSAFPDSFSDSNLSKWGPNSALSSSQSTWGSPSTSQNKQAQSSSTSDWNMTTGSNISSHRGISNTGNSTDSEDSSWGQPKRLPNSGTDGWSQSTSASSYANLVNPSNIGSQPNQWSHTNNTTSPPVSSSAWSSNGTSNNTQTTSSLNNNNSALKPWGVSTASAQNNPPSTSASVSSVSSLNSTASTSTTNSAPTSWAGACAKGLPKVQPKQVEPTDPVQLQIEQSINNPEAWGRTPIRQDTSWGKPPEKKKQDDSNQWQATPNNGTAIWEASKSTNGTTDKYDDKSTWNQKVCGNNDPNVWNGEGEKGKDNNLWDSVENEEDKAIDQNTWNPHESPRTLSQSSAENSDGGWSGHGNRSSPTNVSGPISNGPESNWGATNGATDLRKHSRWESNSPVRSNSVSDADNDRASPSILQQSGVQSTLITPNALLPTANQSRGNNLLWDQTKPSGGIGWMPKQQQSWSENSPSTGSNSWIPGQQTNAGSQTGWAENLNYQWNSTNAAPIRKPTAGGWEDQPSNGDFRDRRILKSESDVALQNDADMGDWNESVSVWTSAVGFKPKKSPMNNESFTPMVQSNRMLNQMPPPVINQASNNMNNSSGNNPAQNFTKSQLLQILVNMGFPKDEAHNALIQNDMNLQGAISDLFKSTNSPIGPGGPSSTNIQPVVPNNMNTPFNAQYNQSIPPSSRLSNKAPARNPIGPGRPTNPMAQQRMIVQQLQLGVQMNNIHPQILNLPLTDQTLRSIQQLLNLQQTYQHHHEQLIQFQRGVKNAGTIQQIEQLTQMLSNIKNQMRSIQQPLLGPQIPKMSSSSDMNSLSLNSLNLNSGSGGSSQQMQSQSQSRLGLWTDKAPGSKHGASSSSPLLHSSNSTPNLQGGVFSDNSPWSMGSGSGWSNVSPNNQFMDNANESQSGNGINQSPSSRANSGSSQSTSFDIPEFIPGQPWPGATGSKIEDDPNITPGSVARSMSLSTAANNPGRSIGPDGDWNKGTWTNQNQDPWQKGSRPPPGLNKHVNRSVSMPQGPSEKTSAFSPVGGSWEKYPVNGNSSTWLVLRNLTPQIDGATLRTLCSQHGPLLSFFVNQSTGQALVQYASKQEGMKAHKSLNSCVLGNTTIITEFADETEVQRIIDQCHRQGSLSRSSSISSSAGSTMWGATNVGANLWGTPANLGPSNASTWGGSNLDGHIFSSGDFHPSNDF